MMELAALFQVLFTGLDLWDHLQSKPLSRRQEEAIQIAVDRIKNELGNIRSQSENNLPKFSNAAHKKAVLEDSWKLLLRDIEPLNKLPTYRRRIFKIVRLLTARSASQAFQKLVELQDSLETTLMRNGK